MSSNHAIICEKWIYLTQKSRFLILNPLIIICFSIKFLDTSRISKFVDTTTRGRMKGNHQSMIDAPLLNGMPFLIFYGLFLFEILIIFPEEA